MNKLLVSVNNLDIYEKLAKVGVTTFLFPLANFCVGFRNTFRLDELDDKESDNYILVNRMLDNNAIEELRALFSKLPKSIKGIVFEDVGVLNMAKSLNLEQELILFQSHFGASYANVNYWLNYADSVFLSNEITKGEIEEIVNEAKGSVCIQVFGLNPILYSRRLLISNYNKYFNETLGKFTSLEEAISKRSFLMFENDYGTMMFNNSFYNALELLELDNIRYFYVNSSNISDDKLLKLVEMIKNKSINVEALELDVDLGFLYQETIYKLKERDKNE